jgi:hypothetical protein
VSTLSIADALRPVQFTTVLVTSAKVSAVEDPLLRRKESAASV